jgi:hypothetical protein
MLRTPKVSWGGPPPAAQQRDTHIAIGLAPASVKISTNVKWPPLDNILIDFTSTSTVTSSSDIGTLNLDTPGPYPVFQPECTTKAVSEPESESI